MPINQHGEVRAPSTSLPAPAPGTIRVAVISDSHVGGQGDAVWHNQLRYADAPASLASAVHAARANRAELLLALGDLADRGDAPSLCDVRAALSVFPGPVRVVAGNHDRVQDNQTFEVEFNHEAGDVRVASSEVQDFGAFGLCGVTVESVDGGLTCTGAVIATEDWPTGLILLLSHYPVLDVGQQLADAGLRNAGLLLNHNDAFRALAERTSPTLVLNGHLHARIEHTVGATLQLSVGALVEHPHEITFVDLTPVDGTIEVQARRMSLPPAEGPDVTKPPVLAPNTTRWAWDGRQWNGRAEVEDADTEDARPVLCLDWNGTVVDDDERAHRVSVDVLAELGLAGDQLATVADFRREFTLPLATFFRGLGVVEDAVDKAVGRWNELMLTAEPPRLTPGALQLLQWAMRHGLEIHVVSGADPRVPAADLQALMPDVRVTSIIGHAHPKSAVLEQYAADGPVVFVGDTTYDVEEGRRAGAVTIGFAVDPVKAGRLAAVGADLVVTDLGEVQDLIATRYRNQETR